MKVRTYTQAEKRQFHEEFVKEWLPYRVRGGSGTDLAHEAVLFLKEKKVEPILTSADIKAAMNHLPAWTNHPKDYIDLIFATNAALLSWYQRQ